ncbi:hypothetical protein EVAR_31673_1 [Eumeta japonica]|uniref:Uncharacterized protein n=1 Tax=Eumeta variegata TaxID=151549 RepID=A0A4C1VTT5_EUMVA|nr:hypothetical protein EVAR_31673_1 [Eumeta japonica]
MSGEGECYPASETYGEGFCSEPSVHCANANGLYDLGARRKNPSPFMAALTGHSLSFALDPGLALDTERGLDLGTDHR